MLYNPKWEKPSLEGFKDWLASQDPKIEFDYLNCGSCSVGQYLASLGTSWEEQDNATRDNLNEFAHRAWVKAHRTCAIFELPAPALTFGDVLRQIEAGK